MNQIYQNAPNRVRSTERPHELNKYRYILLDPHDYTRNAHLAAFLDADTDLKSYYYAAERSDTTLAQYTSHLLEAFKAADPHFADRADAAAVNLPSAERASRLGQAINRSAPSFVVLDAVDQLPVAESSPFFVALGEALDAKTSLVINSRALDMKNWQPLIDAGRAVLLNDNPIPPEPPPHDATVEVYGFGNGRVYADGLPVTVWDGPLTRSLFFFLIDHPFIKRNDVFGAFWPDFSIKDATNVFHVTKRKITERVGYEVIIFSNGFYTRDPEISVNYDVAQFEALVAKGRETPDDIDTWTQAVRLYREPFMHSSKLAWAAERRQQLAGQYAEALIAVARHKASSDPVAAISAYTRALREVPNREDIYRERMTLNAQLGQTDVVRADYEALEKELKRTLNITPGKPTRELYSKLTGVKVK